MILPGTPNERIGDLRTNMGLSQKELSKVTGIAPSQLSRIENGEIKSISSDILVKLAKAFGVSTDYILGLTNISVPKSYDISELGLSEGAVKRMLALKNEMPVLNRLIEHKRFPTLIFQIKAYFHDEAAMGVLGVNKMFELATASLEDLRKEQPEKSADIRDGIRLLKAEKIGGYEIDIERIKNTFLAILRDMKRNMGEDEIPEQTVIVSELFQEMQAQLPEQEPPAIDDVANIITQMVGQAGILDEGSATLLKQLVFQIFQMFGTAGEAQTDADLLQQDDT